jgi:DNA-binding transcriptional LysR family regulator
MQPESNEVPPHRHPELEHKERFVTRDYLDSRLSALEVKLVTWSVGMALAIAAVVSGFGIAILNRLATLS